MTPNKKNKINAISSNTDGLSKPVPNKGFSATFCRAKVAPELFPQRFFLDMFFLLYFYYQ
jgi:hypothetical protein